MGNAGTSTLSYVSLRENGPRFLIQLGYDVREDARPFAGRKYAAISVARGDSLAIIDLLHRVVARVVSVGDRGGRPGWRRAQRLRRLRGAVGAQPAAQGESRLRRHPGDPGREQSPRMWWSRAASSSS